MTIEALTVYRQIRQLILQADLRPGSRLIEADLMARLSTGRTPLRDALHKLAHEGLVEIFPRRGTFVTQVTVADLQGIFEVRAAIEDLVARLSAQRATAREVSIAEDLLRCAIANEREDADVQIDQEMHALLVETANNRYLSEIHLRIADACRRLVNLTRCGVEPKEDQVQTLENIVKGLGSGDGDLLVAVLREHLRDFRERVSGSVFSRESLLRAVPDDATMSTTAASPREPSGR